jgi:N-hydroxyarylamine O-acetyltransferase
MRPIDLDAYFRRIGHTGERAPKLETLRAIHLRHAEAIAFENLNPLLGWPVRLDTAALQQKLVRDGRGGYCFEQNLLLSRVLEALGFEVSGLAARVLWNAPEGAVTPRSHMLLRVDLGEQPYLVDAGFGVLTPTGPLRLEPDTEQVTPHEPYRLMGSGGDFVMQAKLGGEWKALYRFDLQQQFLPDYELTNWYLANHPDSHFVTGLIAARPAPDRRYALRNNELAVHYLGGRTERWVLTSATQLRAALECAFRLSLPRAPELDATLERLVRRNRIAASLELSSQHVSRTA